MKTRDLVDAALDAGCWLYPDYPNDGDVYPGQPAKLPPALRSALVARKVEVLGILRARLGLCSACGMAVTAPAGTVPFARKMQSGAQYHGRCLRQSMAAAAAPVDTQRDRRCRLLPPAAETP